ncbi:MAG TPA: aminotransferase class III-fold pyridoxal phosphate-dependent enzyme, partial [Anaerolineales bacterium]
AVIGQMLDGGMLANAERVGAYLQERAKALYKHSIVGDVRGVGMMLGVEFVADRASRTPFPADAEPGLKVQTAARKRGLLMRANAPWIALGPPLITTERDVDEMLAIVDASIAEVSLTLAQP